MLTAAKFEFVKTTHHAPDTNASIVPPMEERLAFPASVPQQVFWYLEMLQPGVTAFNVPLRFRLEGPLKVDLLEQTINTIIARHEILRTCFAEQDGELLQIVQPEMTIALPLIDLSYLPEARQQDEMDRLGSIEARRPFRLSIHPMIRVELLRLSATTHVFHLTVHHALFDGLSMTVFTGEICRIYQALLEGRPNPLDPLPIQYGDFSVWQKEYLEGPEVAKQLQYWKNKLDGMTELELPSDRPRPSVKSWKGDIISTLLPRTLTDRLLSIAARHGASLFHLDLAAFKILLHRYTGTTDIAIGTPVTGRNREELEPLMGVFINSLIIRTDLSNDPSFSTYLGQVRGTALEALENQDLPFEHLVHHLKPERDPGRNPLFQVNFNHHRCFVGVEKLGDVTMSAVPSRSPGTIFDMHFFMVDRADGWRASCDFSTDLFDTDTAWRMLGHYQKLLEEIAANPERNISEFEILSDSEKHTLLHEWSGKITPLVSEMTIGGLFLETARNYPQRIALSSGETFFTYRQLHAEAAKVASQLCAQNIQPGELVGICTRTSPETIIGLLGILLAGGAYVPLDPDYPSEHFATLLEESGIKVALATESCESAFGKWNGSLLRIFPSGDATKITPLPDITVTSNDPAYLMFTSGSTGKPKGVIVPHRAVARLVKNSDFMHITHEDIFLHAAPLSFDASTLEIWGPLLNGGRLVLPPPKATLDDIANAVRECGVTTLWLTSGLFQVMVEEHIESLKGLRHLLAGGDVLSIPHIKLALESLPKTRLINGYGPTENTTFTTCHNITSADLSRPSIPIGKPIRNTTVFILDSHGRPTPIGIPGELHTGGDGLAIGYHGDAALTAEKFIIHPEFGRLYKTGDLCRWRANGTIEFIGRRDQQVKVRGYRIELGEIEKALLTNPGIRQVKVAVRGNGAESKRILAWMISAGESTPDLSEIRNHLASHLPQYMQPDGLAFVKSFPINANGKINLSALPDPGMAPQEAKAKSYSPPANETERSLAVLWSDLLGAEDIGRDDDFFALGGHSLMALRMFSRINREYGKSLPLAALLKNSTLAALAAMVCPVTSQGEAKAHQGKGHLVTLAEGKPGTSPLVCIHGGDGGVLFYRDLAKRMPENLPVHAIESLELGKSASISPSTVSETSAGYVATLLDIQPEGPFRLVGYSFGGVVAQEMACQLVEMGHKVEFVGLFDTHNPATKFRKFRPHERLSVFWQQHHELPLGQRFSLLRARISEGIATHRRVRAEIAAASKSGPAEPYSDLRRVQVREENWRAMQEHQPRSFPGKLTLFKAISGSDKIEWPVDYGWNTVAAKGLEIIFVPGQHLTLFEPDNIKSLARALTDNLS